MLHTFVFIFSCYSAIPPRQKKQNLPVRELSPDLVAKLNLVRGEHCDVVIQ
jgi:hypothetical protein